MDSIYLDHAATSPLRPEALAEMLPWLLHPAGNPSAAHGPGRRGRAAIDDARDRLAQAIGCASREITFTSGGTEADNLAIRGVVERWGSERGRHVVVSAIEHEAVLATVQSLAERGLAEVTVVGCDRRARVDPAAVAAAVRDDTVLVSVMVANNEVGTVQDLTAISTAVRTRNRATLVHSDAVQALGRLPLRFDELGVDLLSLSAHKAGGPVGVGGLVVGPGVFLGAQQTGGGQERGRRSGTESVAGIVGFASAAAAAQRGRADAVTRMAAGVGRLTRALGRTLPGASLTGDPVMRLPGHLSAIVPGCRSEVLLARLDAAGVAASAASACASGAPLPSHVLLAMGYSEAESATALRLTLGPGTTEADCIAAAERLEVAVAAVRSAAGLALVARPVA